MKWRGISFKREMVLAVMRGQKTQTRRCVERGRIQVDIILGEGPMWMCAEGWNKGHRQHLRTPLNSCYMLQECPYGTVGAGLIVREAIATGDDKDKCGWGARYAADGTCVITSGERVAWRWKPSTLAAMYMPLRLARTFLLITGVRAERLQEIGMEDALREGIEPEHRVGQGASAEQIRSRFRTLWDSINGARAMGWEANPWVWVISFERTERRP